MSITVRKIVEDDLEQIMHWRMDKEITRYMNTDPVLTLEKQREWLNNIRQSTSTCYWLIEVDHEAAGVIDLCNINWEEKYCSWGYYVGEKRLRSLKLAISLEMSLYDYVFDILQMRELRNETFSLNTGVISLHLMCGSTIVNEIKGEIKKGDVFYDVTHMSITAQQWNNKRNSATYEQINFDDSQSAQ